jgi:hypothetical protein
MVGVDVRLQARPGLGVSLHEDGRLELFWPGGARAFRCGRRGTAAWIALQQSEWRPEVAADTLARHSQLDSADSLEFIREWFLRFKQAGLLTDR